MSPNQATVSEQNLDDLVAQIRAEEAATDLGASDEAFSELAGVSESVNRLETSGCLLDL